MEIWNIPKMFGWSGILLIISKNQKHMLRKMTLRLVLKACPNVWNLKSNQLKVSDLVCFWGLVFIYFLGYFEIPLFQFSYNIKCCVLLI